MQESDDGCAVGVFVREGDLEAEDGVCVGSFLEKGDVSMGMRDWWVGGMGCDCGVVCR